MTLPSAEELLQTRAVSGDVDAIRAYRNAWLEAAAEAPCPDPISLPGTPNPRGLICVGYRQAWLDYRDEIRKLKEKP